MRTPSKKSDFEQSARALVKINKCLVGKGGVEPPLPCENQILSLARLPFRHSPNKHLLILNAQQFVYRFRHYKR